MPDQSPLYKAQVMFRIHTLQHTTAAEVLAAVIRWGAEANQERLRLLGKFEFVAIGTVEPREMAVYVDELRSYPEAKVSRRYGSKLWCHLWADTEEELHLFAERLGLQRSWFQNHHRLPEFWHYDLTSSKRRQAIALGAQFKSAFEHGREVGKRIVREARGDEPT